MAEEKKRDPVSTHETFNTSSYHLKQTQDVEMRPDQRQNVTCDERCFPMRQEEGDRETGPASQAQHEQKVHH